MMMNFDDDVDVDSIDNDLKHSDVIEDHCEEIFDFPLFHSTPLLSRTKPLTRPIDFPSLKKYYGLVTFIDHQLPILYRLINETFYVPYIRFSYVLHIFGDSSYNQSFVNIRNLPVIEMTPAERLYYQELSSFPIDSDWSNDQLLSVSMFDGILAIINLTKDFNKKNDPPSVERCKEWRETLSRIRHEARDRWILEEKFVLTRLADRTDLQPSCISSTTMAKSRSLFEQRLNLSIVDEAGGFIQIDSLIYPLIKNASTNQIYLNLNDIRQNLLSSSFPLNTNLFSDDYTAMSSAYHIVIEQAKSNYHWNIIRHGQKNDLEKVLPCPKRKGEDFGEEHRFISLDTFLNHYNKKQFTHPFVQLFETASLDEIHLNYKNNVARQFLLASKRQGGLINGHIPCLVTVGTHMWIPSEMRTLRTMTNDERLFLNMMRLYRGLWKDLLTKKNQWYLKDVIGEQENVQLEILFDNQRSR